MALTTDLAATAREVLGNAALAGSPVVRADAIDRMAEVARRRWSSYARRHPSNAALADRVEDLAKGLRDSMENEPALAGPLMEDYRFVAAKLAEAFTPAG